MNKAEKYRAASLANFTPAELAKVQENVKLMARRFSADHAVMLDDIHRNGLENHRRLSGIF